MVHYPEARTSRLGWLTRRITGLDGTRVSDPGAEMSVFRWKDTDRYCKEREIHRFLRQSAGSRRAWIVNLSWRFSHLGWQTFKTDSVSADTRYHHEYWGLLVGYLIHQCSDLLDVNPHIIPIFERQYWVTHRAYSGPGTS